MSRPRTGIVSKDALEMSSNPTIGFDVRLHELVDAIVRYADLEMQVNKLVKIIREDCNERLGSFSGEVSGPVSGFLSGPTDSRVLSGVSRVPLGSVPGPQKSEKNAKMTRERPGPGRSRVLSGLSGPSEAKNCSLSAPSGI